MDEQQKQETWDRTRFPAPKSQASDSRLGDDFGLSPEPYDTLLPKRVAPNSRRVQLLGTLWADRYELLAVLGHGGMGTVYKARNRLNGQIRAVKILHGDLIHDRDALRRFQHEAKAAARITHANAIQIIDDGVGADGSPFLVMEYIEGSSLADVVRKEKRLTILTGVHIFRQICQALEVAHSNGVIHRDVKPSNVLIIDTPQDPYFVKVLDFGIAKVLPRAEEGTVAVTATGAVIGSPPYMSPEQCLGKELDHRSDIYSLGCLMYECLSGAPPLVGDNQMSTMYKQINELAPPLSGLREDVRLVQEANRIITRAMEKIPERRHDSARQLGVELDCALQKSLKSSPFKALAGLRLQSLLKELSNRVGSSRRAIAIVLFLLIATSIPFSYVSLPYAFVKIPKATADSLPWQMSPHWFAVSYDLLVKFNSAESRLLRQLAHAGNIEKASLYRQLGDLYFDNGSYDQASIRYHQLAVLISKRLQSNPDASEMPGLVHEISYALSRYSRCLQHHGDYRAALDNASMGRNLSLNDTMGDSRYQIFFAQIIGVSTVMLMGESSLMTNDYFDKFVSFIEQKGYGSERPSEIAQSFAEIGDCYFRTGQWQKAIDIYSSAERLWHGLESPALYNRTALTKNSRTSSLREHEELTAGLLAGHGDFAAYNSALTELKIGKACASLERFSQAEAHYKSAIDMLQRWGGENNRPRALAILQLADFDCRRHNFIDGWLENVQALKILKAL